MRINNIDYCVTLFFYDKNGERCKELDFSDFYAVNRYIRENSNDGYEVFYTFRELIDGEPDDYSWEVSFAWKELSEEEIQFQVDDYLRYLAENDEHSEKNEKFLKEFHYRESFCDSEEKKARFHDFAYVCPRCMREVEHCRCKHYPYYLVQIDKLILPIVRELNANGYITCGCCAGHPATEDFLWIYIAFDKDYHFDMPFPAGGKYSKLGHTILYSPPENMPREEYAAFQERVINELMEWADMLLPVANDEFDAEFEIE